LRYAGKFPAPHVIGPKSIAWDPKDIADWLAARKVEPLATKLKMGRPAGSQRAPLAIADTEADEVIALRLPPGDGRASRERMATVIRAAARDAAEAACDALLAAEVASKAAIARANPTPAPAAPTPMPPPSRRRTGAHAQGEARP
jgi:hypothetical protein